MMKARKAFGNRAEELPDALASEPKAALQQPDQTNLAGLVSELQVRQAALEKQYSHLAQLEKNLHENFADLMNAGKIGFLGVDHRGLVQEANAYFCELLQVEAQQLLGKNFSAFVSKRHLKGYKKFSQRLLDGFATASAAVALVGGKGRELEVTLQGTCGVDADGERYLRFTVVPAATGTLVYYPDKKNQADEKLQQSEMLLRETQSIAHVGSFRYNLEQNELVWSDEMFRIHGLEPGEIKPTLIYMIKHTFVDDQVLIREVLFKAFRSKIPFSITRRFLRPDGEIRYIHVTGKFYGPDHQAELIGTAQDITEARKTEIQIRQKNQELQLSNSKLRNEIEGRQRVEEALMESEKKWRTLVENTPDSIARFDRDLHCVFLNHGTTPDPGLSAVPLSTLPQLESSFLKADPAFLSKVEEVFRTGAQAHAYTLHPTPSSICYNYSILVPESGPEGEVKTVLSISRDITEAKQKENLLNGVLDSSSWGIAAIQAFRDEQHQITDFTWVHINKAAEIILQRSIEELRGTKVQDLLSGNKPSGLFDDFVHTVETGETMNRTIFYDFDYLKAWYQFVAVKMEDGLVVTFADISEHKKAEEKIRRKKAELLEAQEIGRLGNWCYNLKTQKFTCSRELERILGIAKEDISSLSNFLRFVHPQDRNLMQHAVHQAVVELKPFCCEYRLVRPDGVIRWISARGKAILDRHGNLHRLAGIGQDITELKEVERQVRLEKEQKERIIEYSINGVSAFDKDGKYFVWNKALEDFTGLRRDEVIGRGIFDVFPSIREDKMGQKFRDVLKGKRRKIRKAPFVAREGFFEADLVPLFDNDGQLAGGICIVHDITESVKLKEITVTHKLARQKELIDAVLQAQEAEHKRMATLMHNGIEQLLHDIQLHLEHLTASEAESIKRVEEQELMLLIQKAIGEVRSLSSELMPIILEDYGLEVALADLCTKLSSANLQLRMGSFTCLKKLDSRVEIAVYRIIQELIKSVFRHTHGTVIRIDVACNEHQLVFGVSDNGTGYTSGGLIWQEDGGLRTIRNRLKLMSGNLTINSGKKRGTQVKITLAV